MTPRLEHINITVTDAEATAAVFCDLFGWHIRWQGSVMNGAGISVHVGTDDDYIALYGPADAPKTVPGRYGLQTRGGLNHIGVVVEDLGAAEARVIAAGYKPHMHADYEPGKRFYFDGPDGVEFEVVSYG